MCVRARAASLSEESVSEDKLVVVSENEGQGQGSQDCSQGGGVSERPVASFLEPNDDIQRPLPLF